MSHSNAWSNPSAVSAEDAARTAVFPEDRVACPDQAQAKRAALRDAVAGRPGRSVCSKWAAAAARTGRGSCGIPRPGGEMVGVDVAPDMVEAARRYAASDPQPPAPLPAGERGGSSVRGRIRPAIALRRGRV